MKELFQSSQEFIHSLLIIMKTYPELPVIELPAPNLPTKIGKSKSKQKTTSQEVIHVEFIELERNLAAIGFFSASSKRIKNKKGKTLTLSKTIKGHKIKVSAEIVPGSKFGLPSIADQEKWFAFCYLLSARRRQHGKLTNPIRFSSGEILKMLGQVDSGRNYEELNEWLDVMSATTIISNGALYRAAQKAWVSHGRRRFHVFDRADSKGTRLDDGTVLDKHEVELSTWQLENVNAEYFLLFDHPLYGKLKKSIAKTLLPLLHTWLFAARKDGRFEKCYDEICEVLQITYYRHRSRMTEQLGPSLNELVEIGYLSKWELLKTSDGKGYKVAFYGGAKAFQSRRRQKKALAQPDESVNTSDSSSQKEMLLQQLKDRGISNPEKFVLGAADEELVADCIGYWDTQPNVGAGLLVSLIRRKVALPATFETTAERRKQEAAAEQTRSLRLQKQELQRNYDQYVIEETGRHIAERVPADEYRAILDAQKKKLSDQYVFWRDPNQAAELERMAQIAARNEITQRLTIPTFEEWAKTRRTDAPRSPPHVAPGDPKSNVEAPVDPGRGSST